jgi:hypothetical protein
MQSREMVENLFSSAVGNNAIDKVGVCDWSSASDPGSIAQAVLLETMTVAVKSPNSL